MSLEPAYAAVNTVNTFKLMRSLATFTWGELLEATGGELVAHHRHFENVSIETDTRQLSALSEADSVFYLPIIGKTFDGQDFIAEAYQTGIEGAFVTQAYLTTHPELNRFPNLIVVSDTTHAYLALGRFHRRRCGACVVAITGSSGKTTTKDMLYLMLSLAKKTQRSEKNFNNEFGVAQTLLGLEPETDVLILEMGMRGKGQISLLTRYAEPDIAIITNVGTAHIGLLGSTEAIAQAKCEILEGLSLEAGVAILNGDDPLLLRTASGLWQGREEVFTLHDVDNIHRFPPSGLMFDYQEFTFKMGIIGPHNVLNALACLKVAECLNINLKRLTKALELYDGGEGRWEKLCLDESKNLWVINDAYNANPDSLKASLISFGELRSEDTDKAALQKIVFLAHLAELGDFEKLYYERLTDWMVAHESELSLVFVGEKARLFYSVAQNTKLKTQWVESIEAAVSWVSEYASSNAVFLLKGSREARLDEFIPLFKAVNTTTNAPHAVS